MIEESNLVALLVDLPTLNLFRGDVGTVALVHGNQQGFEVEFVDGSGHTVAVETLRAGEVKKINQGSTILHVAEQTLKAA